MAKLQVKGSKKPKKKPPSQRGDRGSIIGFTHQCRWWLCCDSRTKRNSAAQCSTQKCRSEPCRLAPTLSRSFAVAAIQLILVWSSVLAILPPNLAVCPRVGVWDKTWDKFANYFETASPQFYFCSGDKNGLVLRRIIARNGCQKDRFSSLASVWRSES